MRLFSFGKKPTTYDVNILLDVLQQCRALCDGSDDALYSSTAVREIVEMLDVAIAALKSGNPINVDDLRLLFAPTGALEKTSMDNGWPVEYLELSEQFDRLVKNWG